MIDDIQFQQTVFDLINGYMELERNRIPESKFVQNEFSEGSLCNQAYGRVMDAYARLCNGLHPDKDEDEDIDIIIDEMNSINHHLCIKMFQYGVLFARNEKL